MLNTLSDSNDFLHRCRKIYLHRNKTKEIASFSLLLVLNRFGIIEQIAQNLCMALRRRFRALKPLPFTFMHFIYTISYSPNCKSPFVLCVPSLSLIDICRFCDGCSTYTLPMYIFLSSFFSFLLCTFVYSKATVACVLCK